MTMFSAPDAYERFIGRYAVPLARELADAAGVAAPARALDVGCGTGALTGELVARLGPASVCAIDPSPMARVCGERHPGVDVREGGGESLPWADDTFDQALAQLVVNFMADPAGGVAEMIRVTRAGGTVSAATWDYGGEMVLLRSFWEAASALDPAAGATDERLVMRLCSEPELRALWEGSALRDVRVTAATVSTTYEDFADLWTPLETGIGPAGQYVASLAPEPRAALRAGLRERLGVGEDAPFTLPARAWIAVGTVA